MLPNPIRLSVSEYWPEKEEKTREKLFLKDPKADLFISVGSIIYPIHREFFSGSKLISRIPKNKKFITIKNFSHTHVSFILIRKKY